MGTISSTQNAAYDDSDQSGLNPGQPHRRPVERYLFFQMLQIFITLGVWQIALELVEYKFHSLVYRLGMYVLLILCATTFIVTFYDENLDSAI